MQTTIAAMWEEFERRTLSGFGATQRDIFKSVFYYGAMALMKINMDLADLTDDEAVNVIAALDKELTAFALGIALAAVDRRPGAADQ